MSDTLLRFRRLLHGRKLQAAHIRSVLLLAGLLACGCSSGGKDWKKDSAPDPLAKPDPTRAGQVQQSIMIFADQFIPALAEGCDYIERHATNPEARAAARSRKVGTSFAALKNAVNPHPYAGLLDMVVMVTLLSDGLKSPAARELYGPYTEPLSTALALQRAQVWALAAEYVTEAQLQELAASIKEWQDVHPERQYLAFVRIAKFPDVGQMQSGKGVRRPNSVFGLLFLDPLSNLDPAVREFEQSRQLAERAFFYLQRMPLVIAWEGEEIFADMISAPEIHSAISSIGTISNSTSRFVESANRVTTTLETFRGDIDRMRHDALTQVEQATARQRDATIRQATTQISQLRDSTIEQAANQISLQRDATIRQATTQISMHRDAIVQQFAAAVRQEQGEIAVSFQGVLNRSIDRLYWRVLIVLGLYLAVTLGYRAIFRRRGRGLFKTSRAGANRTLRRDPGAIDDIQERSPDRPKPVPH